MTVSARLLFFFPFILAIIFASTNWLYWPMVLRAGLLPPEGDSIAIPMFTGVILAPVMALLMFLWAFPALKNAPDDIDILASGTGVRGRVGNLIYGGGALASLMLAVLIFNPSNEMLDAIWLLFVVPLVIWNLLLRAAFVVRHNPS